MLTAEVLKSLKAGGMVRKRRLLRQDDIYSLYQLRNESPKSSWEDVVQWLEILFQDVPVGLTGQNIRQQWEKLIKDRAVFKKRPSMYAEKLINWDNLPYTFPNVNGQRPPADHTAAIDTRDGYACGILKEVNVSLCNEMTGLQKENAELLERPTQHEMALAARREERHKAQLTDSKSETKNLSISLQKSLACIQSAEAHKREASAELSSAKHDMKKIKVEHDKVCTSLNKQRAELLECKEVNAILLDSVVSNSSKSILLFNSQSNCFRPELTKCIWKLLDANVAHAQVPNVLKAVFQLGGITYDRIPSVRTIQDMDKQRLLASQKQLQIVLAEKQRTCLLTDETPKHGECYESYLVNDEDQNTYLIGMRHMHNKASQSVLDTLKEIVSDIDDTCEKMTVREKGKNIGSTIVANLKSTMSDRAKTEIKFQELLESFRSDCLPLYKEGWHEMNDETKQNMTVIHNFFCGLHLMVGMADTVCASLAKFEELSCEEDQLIQSPSSFGTVVRAIRETCKALSRGGDEKSGCFRQWRVFCERHSNSDDIPLVQNFKGNRFNIVFLLGGNVYYLHKKIIQLLQEMKEPNGLLKSVLDNLLNPLVIAGCKALGLLRKLIMNPLWRLTEHKNTHILEMNQHYLKLSEFLGQCAENDDTLLEFLAGRLSPFQESLIEKDKVFDYLCEGGKYDELCAKIIKPTMMSLKLYVQRAVADQLPLGRYWQSSDQLRHETTATPKHNKAPERIFGMLDFLVHRRPNASALTNEAYLLFSHNRTSTWIDTLSLDELNQLMTSVRIGTKDLKAKFKDREKEIMRLHSEKQVKDAEKIAELRKKRLERKTELTESVIDSGLWQTKEQVIEKLGECDSDAEKRRALTKQIRFRNEVLCQHHEDKSVFVFSISDSDKRRKFKSSDVLCNNLIELIISASCVATSQSISKNGKEKEYIPLIVGKHVNHKFGDGETYAGKVISQVPGFPAWYNITYEGDDAVYSYRLIDDYRTGDIEILP